MANQFRHRLCTREIKGCQEPGLRWHAYSVEYRYGSDPVYGSKGQLIKYKPSEFKVRVEHLLGWGCTELAAIQMAMNKHNVTMEHE